VTLKFAILGDSIAYGQGASAQADTIAARLSADLTGHGLPNQARVFAVSGSCTSDLRAQVERALLWQPGLALIIIGANDLTRFVPPQQAAAQLGDAVRALRAVPAEVVVAPAPDLSVVPWVPIQMRAAVQAGSRVLHDAQTRSARLAGARVADFGMTAASGFARDPALFSADRFHPSSAGYAVIAAALAPTLRQAAQAAHADGRHAA
jgi:lysophospholipase L1-like esterase